VAEVPIEQIEEELFNEGNLLKGFINSTSDLKRNIDALTSPVDLMPQIYSPPP
jgi:hypothetical protein